MNQNLEHYIYEYLTLPKLRFRFPYGSSFGAFGGFLLCLEHHQPYVEAYEQLHSLLLCFVLFYVASPFPAHHEGQGLQPLLSDNRLGTFKFSFKIGVICRAVQ
jgi:hypothetical protein